MRSDHALIINWDDNIKINVVYETYRDSDEPRPWVRVVTSWKIESLAVGDTSYTDRGFIKYLSDTMSDKHRDYIQTACEEDSHSSYLPGWVDGGFKWPFDRS